MLCGCKTKIYYPDAVQVALKWYRAHSFSLRYHKICHGELWCPHVNIRRRTQRWCTHSLYSPNLRYRSANACSRSLLSLRGPPGQQLPALTTTYWGTSMYRVSVRDLLSYPTTVVPAWSSKIEKTHCPTKRSDTMVESTVCEHRIRLTALYHLDEQQGNHRARFSSTVRGVRLRLRMEKFPRGYIVLNLPGSTEGTEFVLQG